MLSPFWILMCLVTAYLAHRKGYNPLCWLFGGGLIGLIVLAFRPFTNKSGLSEQERVTLKQRGNRIGLVVTGLMVALNVVSWAVL